MDSEHDTGRVAFGLFEADVRSGELWRGSHRIKLAAQPFRVLAVLLSKPGEVVSREELQTKVWGSNVNVDFERAVAGAINKVREALSDSADNPRFVQTLPKRGYRFIAPVQPVHTTTWAKTPTIEALPTPVQVPVSMADAVEVDHVHPFATIRQSQIASHSAGAAVAAPNRMVFTLIIGLILAIVAVLWSFLRRPVDVAPLRIEQLTHNGAISTGPPSQENLLTLATDGDRILTAVMRDGQPHLSTVSIGTSDVQILPLPQELSSSLLADVSKDGTRLLLRNHSSSASEQPLWIVPSSGGSAFRVGNVLAHDAAWMPDGESILYASGNDLFIIRLDNGTSTPFAHLNGRAFWMRWSPDGKALRFTLLNPVTHSSEIWETGSRGNAPRPAQIPLAENARTCCGIWTADGGSYIFASGDNLWQMRGSGRLATVQQLTNGPLRFLSPAAARTGTRIFFMGLDHPLGLQTFTAGQGFHAAPAFLADATRVTYSRDGLWVAWTDNNEKLWRARAADGSDKVRLTPAYFETFLAHWSPDNKQLAVMAREPGKLWRIYLVDASGGAPEPVLNENRNEADPDWSADGKHLVFGREADLMGKESGSHAIQILDLNTKKTDAVSGSEGLFSPRWSPDGRWIAALSLDQKTIMLYDVVQQHWRELARMDAADPVWSADSQTIYVHAFLEPEQPIVKIGVADGVPHEVANLEEFHERGIVNYFFGGITPANQLLVQPQIGTGDLYTLDLEIR